MVSNKVESVRHEDDTGESALDLDSDSFVWETAISRSCLGGRED